jgi:CRP-like cAMP-binding protein
MKKGEEGDCMYILVKGEVGVYIGAGEDNCVAMLGDNKIFGERALETNEKRGATIKAHKKTITMILNKNDFKEIVYHVKMLQKSQRKEFLI